MKKQGMVRCEETGRDKALRHREKQQGAAKQQGMKQSSKA
jgi:hypothetical protein